MVKADRLVSRRPARKAAAKPAPSAAPSRPGIDLSPSPPVGFESTKLSVTVKEAHGWEVLETVLVNVSIDGELLGVQVPFILPASGITLNYWTMRPAGVHEVKAAIAAPDVVEESVSNNVVVNQVEWLQPVEYSQSLGGVAGEYHVGDVIKAVFRAREKSSAPLPGATVTVRDSLGGSASLTTDSLGLAYYQFNASKSGVHFLEFRTSKNGYFTYWQKQSFKVIDWNARVHVTVHDRWGNPVYKASVARANVTKGTTAKDGTFEFLTDKGYNALSVYCPDQTQCQSWIPYVENTTFLDVTCTCKNAFLSFNATWFTNSSDNLSRQLNGRPVTFVYVRENGEVLGKTGLDGISRLGKVTFGQHLFTLEMCASNGTGGCARYVSSTFRVNVENESQTVDVLVSGSAITQQSGQEVVQDYVGPMVVSWRPAADDGLKLEFVAVSVVAGLAIVGGGWAVIAVAGTGDLLLISGVALYTALSAESYVAYADCVKQVQSLDMTESERFGYGTTCSGAMLGTQILLTAPVAGPALVLSSRGIKPAIEINGVTKQLPTINEQSRVALPGEVAACAETPVCRIRALTKGTTDWSYFEESFRVDRSSGAIVPELGSSRYLNTAGWSESELGGLRYLELPMDSDAKVAFGKQMLIKYGNAGAQAYSARFSRLLDSNVRGVPIATRYLADAAKAVVNGDADGPGTLNLRLEVINVASTKYGGEISEFYSFPKWVSASDTGKVVHIVLENGDWVKVNNQVFDRSDVANYFRMRGEVIGDVRTLSTYSPPGKIRLLFLKPMDAAVKSDFISQLKLLGANVYNNVVMEGS